MTPIAGMCLGSSVLPTHGSAKSAGWTFEGSKGLGDGPLELGCPLRSGATGRKTIHILAVGRGANATHVSFAHFQDKAERHNTLPWCFISLGGRNMLFSAPSWALGTSKKEMLWYHLKEEHVPRVPWGLQCTCS